MEFGNFLYFKVKSLLKKYLSNIIMIFAALLLGIPQAKYSSQFSIPFVGMQRIAIDIKSSNEARLQMKGILNIDDSVSFTCDKTGNLGFYLSDQTIKK
jgi:hypothetical protein